MKHLITFFILFFILSNCYIQKKFTSSNKTTVTESEINKFNFIFDYEILNASHITKNEVSNTLKSVIDTSNKYKYENGKCPLNCNAQLSISYSKVPDTATSIFFAIIDGLTFGIIPVPMYESEIIYIYQVKVDTDKFAIFQYQSGFKYIGSLWTSFSIFSGYTSKFKNITLKNTENVTKQFIVDFENFRNNSDTSDFYSRIKLDNDDEFTFVRVKYDKNKLIIINSNQSQFETTHNIKESKKTTEIIKLFPLLEYYFNH